MPATQAASPSATHIRVPTAQPSSMLLQDCLDIALLRTGLRSTRGRTGGGRTGFGRESQVGSSVVCLPRGRGSERWEVCSYWALYATDATALEMGLCGPLLPCCLLRTESWAGGEDEYRGNRGVMAHESWRREITSFCYWNNSKQRDMAVELSLNTSTNG